MIPSIAGLSSDELLELRQRINAALAVSGASGLPAAEPFENWMLECFLRTARDKGIDIRNTRHLPARTMQAFRAKLPPLQQYLARQHPQRRGQQLILSFGVILLVQSLQQLGLPISATVLLVHAHRIPSLLDRAFPGYGHSGMLGLLAERSHLFSTS